jgi:NADPH2:quinone reductase
VCKIGDGQGLREATFPFTPGSEAAGTITAVGEGVRDFAVGDRVATAEGFRTYSAYTVVEAAKALPVPEGLDLLTAAALPLQGMTAHYLVTSSFRIEPGHTALVHAGAGGTGRLLIQFLKMHGARRTTGKSLLIP